MASVARDRNGRLRLLVSLPGGERVGKRLGRMPMKAARRLADLVNTLEAFQRAGVPIDPVTAEAASRLPAELSLWLAELGLLEERSRPQTVQDLVDEFYAGLSVKPGTLAACRQGTDSFLAFAGPTTPLATLDTLLVERWRQAMRKQGLAPATVAKRCRTLRNVFRTGVRLGMLPRNPAEGLKIGGQVNESRRVDIPLEVCEQLRAGMTCPWLRLAFTLARWGALRIPSEIVGMTWADVHWDTGRLTVRSPKTEAHEGRGRRVVPMTAEMEQELREAFERAEDGAVYVFPARWRRRGVTMNLRTALLRAIHAAGLTPWPRLWQNLRATRASEWAAAFPVHVAEAFAGHTAEVAKAQ
ncbi:MAG: tyrosine-type recombinase/integrase [Fimbriimonadaceae bacterium]